MFDKYDLYQKAVQSPEEDVVFVAKTYRKLKKRKPISLREDFCGTFRLCCEWVKLHKEHRAFGVDIDPEPIGYGNKHHFLDLKKQQQQRVQIENRSVLAKGLPRSDIVLAQNFSYYLFKERKGLKEYFQNVYKHLHSNGLFILDAFGGPECEQINEESVRHKGFTYYWAQKNFNPVSRSIHCAIHFKKSGDKKRKDVFTYDWRLWTLPEIKDILEEVGFCNVHFYWEETGEDGEGNGVFKLVSTRNIPEPCESWVAYIICEKN